VLVVNPLEVVVYQEEHAEQQQEQQQAQEDTWNQVQCEGCVGACVGCLTGGFWLSLVCATGCVYADKQHDGTTGALARGREGAHV
jgi:hypothetical protein